jgi:hypothetical protein
MAATQFGAVGELEKALAVDQHGIEPIPDDDRDSTAWRQFWIWSVAWMGLNTYVVLDLATYRLHKLGLPNSHATEYGVAAVIMIIQLIIGGEAPTTRIRAIASRQHSGQRSTRVRSARSRSRRATDRQP